MRDLCDKYKVTFGYKNILKHSNNQTFYPVISRERLTTSPFTYKPK